MIFVYSNCTPELGLGQEPPFALLFSEMNRSALEAEELLQQILSALRFVYSPLSEN